MANSLKESYVRGAKADKDMAGKMGEKELDRVTIEEAENGGFVVKCSWKSKPKKGNGEMQSCGTMYDEETNVAKDFDALIDLVEDLLGD